MVFFRLKGKKSKYVYNFKRKPKLVKKVKALATKVRRLSPETKYADLAVTGQTFNYTPTSSYVQNVTSMLAQGTGDANSYTGDQIFLKNIMFRCSIYNTSTSYQLYRLVLVCVKQNMEQLITIANIGNLVMESVYSSSANAVNAPLDNDNRHGVTILWDKRFVLNPNLSSATTSNQALMFSRRIKVNKMLQFQNGGNVATKNSLFLFFISDAAASGYMNYIARLSYTDV